MTPPITRPLSPPHASPASPVLPRQFVNFAFFKLDPAFRRLSNPEKQLARDQFQALFQSPQPGLICLTYSTMGLPWSISDRNCAHSPPE